MSARSGLVRKNPPGPIWGHLRPFFPWTGKNQKMPKFCLFSLVGQWALFTRFSNFLISRFPDFHLASLGEPVLHDWGTALSGNNPDFWDLEIQKFGVKKMKNIKILKIQICSAQNVGKVWISRKKILPTLFGAI